MLGMTKKQVVLKDSVYTWPGVLSLTCSRSACSLWRHKWLLPTLLWRVEQVKVTGLLSHSWWVHWQYNTQIIAGKHSWWFIVGHIRQGGKWVNGLISSRWGCRPHSLPSSGPLWAASECSILHWGYSAGVWMWLILLRVWICGKCVREREDGERGRALEDSQSQQCCLCCPTSA